MSLIIIIHDDGSGDRHVASYNWRVQVGNGSKNDRLLASGRIRNHDRALSWRELVRKILPPSANTS